MATIKELALKRSDIFYVDPRVLKIKDGWNARGKDDPENKEWIMTLARSIASVGVQDPMIVYQDAGEYYLVDGHCRLAATFIAINTFRADIKAVPIRTQGRSVDEGDRELTQLLTDGKPKTPYEAGIIYKRLEGFGWSVDKIAERSGRSVASINAALDLQGAPVQVQKLVASGRVSATLATETLRKEGAAKATATLNDAVDVATQKGKARATKADIGEAPVQRLSAAGKLARIREIVDYAVELDLDATLYGEGQALQIGETEYRELLKLLGL